MLDEVDYTTSSEIQTTIFFQLPSVFRKAFNFLVSEEEEAGLYEWHRVLWLGSRLRGPQGQWH